MTSIDEPRSSPWKQILSYAGLAITGQPVSGGANLGDTHVFGPVTYTSQFPITPVLQWQIQMYGPFSVWQNLTEIAGFYEGVSTATLTIKSVDNFLANLPSRNFRLAIHYPGTAAIYSDTVLLVIARHTNWIQGFSAFTSAPASGVTFPIDPAKVPTVSVPGVTTYQWNFVSGDAFTAVTPTAPNTDFNYSGGGTGLKVSIWTCTIIVNGFLIQTTDPIYVGAYIGAPDGSNNYIDPDFTSDGLAYSVSPANFNGWSLALLQRQRTGALNPTISIAAPADPHSTFPLSITYPAGTAIVEVLFPNTQLTAGQPVFLGGTAYIGLLVQDDHP